MWYELEKKNDGKWCYYSGDDDRGEEELRLI
jgi:hypothetical protein